MNISVCIPSYNRQKYLQECIESIIPQLEENDEIVVCDNCSTDGTREYVAETIKVVSNLRYFRNDSNLGFDSNVSLALNAANKDFVWLLGDDDALVPDSLRRIREIIVSNPQIGGITCLAMPCDATLKPVSNRMAQVKLPGSTFLSPEDAIAELGVWMGFISCQIIRAENVKAICRSSSFRSFGQGFEHLNIIYRSAIASNQWYFHAQREILCRGGNDGFWQRDFVARMELEPKSYGMVFDHISINKGIKKHVLEMLCTSNFLGQILISRKERGILATAKAALPIYYKYYPFTVRSFLIAFGGLLTPYFILNFIKVMRTSSSNRSVKS